MKWIRYRDTTGVAIGVLQEEEVISLKDVGYNIEDFQQVIDLRKSQYIELVEKIKNYKGHCCKIEDIKIMSPIKYPRQDVLCVGLNYYEHCREANQYEKDNFSLDTKGTVYFSKRVNEVSSYTSDISCHQGVTSKFDYETELAVILKEDCTHCTIENVEDYIFGYTLVNDYSARDLQTKHQQWYLGKSLDGSFAMGQFILSKDEVRDVQELEIKTYVNGDLRQSSSTQLMMKSVNEIIMELSSIMKLKKGTIIATGTPQGVGMGLTPPQFLKLGDEVISEIEQLGYIRNKIV